MPDILLSFFLYFYQLLSKKRKRKTYRGNLASSTSSGLLNISHGENELETFFEKSEKERFGQLHLKKKTEGQEEQIKERVKREAFSCT